MNLKETLSQKARLALLGGVLLAAAAGVVTTQSASARQDGEGANLQLRVDKTEVNRDINLTTSFAPVVKEVAASVVSISTETRPREIRGMQQLPQIPWFREFFGDRFGNQPFMTPRQEGLGSGVIMTEDGYILTNNHVIENADEIKVTLNPDGREYPAKVVGRDPKSDIAVLKINATGLQAIRLGDSDKVEVGDVVLAIGNPFGVGQTVTMGIVGATSRAVFGPRGGLEYEDFIQTDAAINPGNSGGALIDAQGRLIGVNTAILSRGGGNNGVGFAVPSNLARTVMESIVQHGRVVRGFLGVNIQPLNPVLAKAFKTKSTSGALVTQVMPKSPAEKAGIKSGDVITKFDGRDVRDPRNLQLMVSQTPPEKEVTVEIVRDGRPRTLDLTVKELPSDGQQRAGAQRGQGSEPMDTGGLKGVVVGDITAAARRQFEIPDDIVGALVTRVDEDSAAWDAGLRAGDVLREINGKRVTDAESAIDAVQGLENTEIVLRVWRAGANLYLGVDETNRE
jgi:serine protease Do